MDKKARTLEPDTSMVYPVFASNFPTGSLSLSGPPVGKSKIKRRDSNASEGKPELSQEQEHILDPIHDNEGSGEVEYESEITDNRNVEQLSPDTELYVAVVTENSWGFTRLTLGEERTVVEFDNGVTLTWEAGSVSSPRAMAIEVFAVPKSTVDDCSKTTLGGDGDVILHYSPFVCVDQRDEDATVPFRKPVRVKLPLEQSSNGPSNGDIEYRVYRLKEPYGNQTKVWTDVTEAVDMIVLSNRVYISVSEFSIYTAVCKRKRKPSQSKRQANLLAFEEYTKCNAVLLIYQHPVQRTVIVFDCKRRDDPQYKQIKLAQGLLFPLPVSMRQGQKIYGKIVGNLKVDGTYGVPLPGGVMVFHYPYHIQNHQDFFMVKKCKNQDPAGAVKYYTRKPCEGDTSGSNRHIAHRAFQIQEKTTRAPEIPYNAHLSPRVRQSSDDHNDPSVSADQSDIHRAVLIRNLPRLVDNLQVSHMESHLLQSGIFDRRRMKMIMSEATEWKRAQIMLDMLPAQGPAAFEGFIVVLRQTGFQWLAQQLCEDIERVTTRIA